MRAIIGRKIGMTRYFESNGKSNAATIIEAGPCVVTEVKTKETHGYNAVQVGFGVKKEKQLAKPQKGLFTKLNIAPVEVLKEMRDLESDQPLKPGDTITVDSFATGDRVNVTGISKGKGFQGVIKRHHFNGGPVTHGQSDRLRAPGSIGSSSYPSRVYKGLRMAGQMGNQNVTVRGLQILKVDLENNIIIIKGAVPGANKGIVLIRK
ncbi:MAG TPA: 50S ribosomal protein L3 [bacterium]|nr:50S ribosomal protein L3 [bacterium]HPN41911.1 50S ribosomal protein L3 [bacterium]